MTEVYVTHKSLKDLEPMKKVRRISTANARLGRKMLKEGFQTKEDMQKYVDEVEKTSKRIDNLELGVGLSMWEMQLSDIFKKIITEPEE